MPLITALLHTHNDARRLGRALETLRCCDEIIIVDHGSRDGSLRIAREYGARALCATETQPAAHYARSARNNWVLCLDPCESLTEGLETTFLEWKLQASSPAHSAYSVFLREETREGWHSIRAPQVRLVPRDWPLWQDRRPAIQTPSASVLEGELLRFTFP